MSGARTFRCNGFRSGAGLLRVPQFPGRRDSVCSRKAFSAIVILTILVAVSTALIAPSIDMPDGVLHEHHAAGHSAGGHGSNTLVNSGSSTPVEAHLDQSTSQIAEILHSPHSGHDQLSVVMRC